MPVGVITSTSTIPGPGVTDPAPGSGYFVVGQTTRGNATVPVRVSSPQQFASFFGPQFSAGFLTNDLTAFFGEKGTHAYVMRVVGSTATAASITLNDKAGTPVPTLKLQAGCGSIDPVANTNLGNIPDTGVWGNALSVAVTASLVTGQYIILVYLAGVLVETWGPFADVPTAVASINTSSSYLVATNLFSATGVGGNANPAVLSATVLSGGTDNASGVTSSTMSTALASFSADLGPGYVAIPGYDASLVGTALVAHASAYGRIAHLSPTEGMSSTAVASAAAVFRGTTGSQAAGYFWPWVTIPNGAGGSLVVPPDGAVAGRRSATIASIGPWQSPAGAFGAFQFVTGLDPASGLVNDTIGNSLNDNHVNVIRPKAGGRLYGWRSLSADTVNYELLNQQDILNVLEYQIKTALEAYVFAIIDPGGQLFFDMTTDIEGILSPYITAGALYPGPADSSGAPSDPGYLVDTSSDVNTPQTLAANEAVVATYVRPSPTAELILASTAKVAVSSSF